MSRSSMLIKGASSCTTAGTADYLIAEGKFADPAGAAKTVETIEATGLLILPGLVDLHTHLREPGREDAETIMSGTAAAARGGFTTVFAMANTNPVTDTAEAATNLLTASQGAAARVVPIGAVTKSLAGAELAELGLMAQSQAQVRVFSDDGACVSDARLMRRALEYVRAFDGVIAQHAQDPRLADGQACCHEGPVSGRLGLPGWPAEAESTIVARDIQLAELTRSRLHVCHVSSAQTVAVIREAKQRGAAITAEVTPHHLMLTVDELVGYDPTYKVNPPLREPGDVEALRAALADGTIDVIATDHAPHARQDKEQAFVEAANGMLGLETALAVALHVMINTKLWGWPELVAAMSTRPAQIGRIAAPALDLGSPADFILVDPNRRRIVDAADSASLSRNNPWHGRELPDPVVLTVHNGVITYRNR